MLAAHGPTHFLDKNECLSVSAETDELWEDIWMELPPEIETI